jgi:hypothetical protein
MIMAAVGWTTPAHATLQFTMLQQSPAQQGQAPQMPTPVAILGRAASGGAAVGGVAELLDVSTNADLLGVFIMETAGALGFDGIVLATQLDRVLLIAVPQYPGNRSCRTARGGSSARTMARRH